MIKAVIFDYDETLTKTIEGRAKAYSDFAQAEYGQELTTTKVKETFGKPYEEFMEILFNKIEPTETIIAKYQKFSESYPPIPYEGAVEVVNNLFKKYLVGIVSGVRRRGLNLDLAKLEFDQKMFFHIQCGDEWEILKPDPKVFEPLKTKLRQCGIKDDEVVYIGNDLNDWQASTAAGFKFIGMVNHTNPLADFKNKGAETVELFEELEEKINLI